MLMCLGLFFLTSWATGAIGQEVEDAQSADEERARRTLIKAPNRLLSWDRPSLVIDRGQLLKGMGDLADAMDDAPAIRVRRMGGIGSFSLPSIRGSTGQQVIVLWEGIPLNAGDGTPVDLSGLPMGPLGSATVYHGHAPFTLGSSAIGGVIDLKTLRVSGTYAELDAGGGSFGTRFARTFASTEERTWGAALAIDHLATDGDFSFQHDGGTAWDDSDDRRVTRQNNAMRQFSIMARARALLAEGVTLTTLNLFTLREQGLAGNGLYVTQDTRLLARRNLAALRLNAHEIAGSPLDLGLLATVAFSEMRYEDPLGQIGLDVDRSHNQSLVPRLQLHLRVPWESAEGALILVPKLSLSYGYESHQGKRHTGLSAGSTVWERHAMGAAAELALGWLPIDTEFFITGRYEGVLSHPSNNPTTDKHTGAFRAEIRQRSIPQLTLGASASQGYRFPNLFELFGNAGYVQGNPELRPESAFTLDLSLRHDARWIQPPNFFWLEMHAFTTWVEDLIQYAQNTQNVLRAANIDKAFIGGIDLGLHADVIGHLRLSGSVSWMHTENRGDIVARKGKRLPYRPAWQAHGNIEYYHRFSAGIDEVAGYVEIDGLSRNYQDHANQAWVSERIVLGLGLRMAWHKEQLQLTFSAQNITNNRVQDLAGFPLPGVTLMCRLRWVPDVDAWQEETP